MSNPIPLERSDAAGSFAAKHSLALLEPDPDAPGGVAMCGSGTLVLLQGRRFILTATVLRKHETIYYTMTHEFRDRAGGPDAILP
jgi:hypothetical protein